MGETKKTLMEAVTDIEEYLLKEKFSANEALTILRELETTAVVATVLSAIDSLKQD